MTLDAKNKGTRRMTMKDLSLTFAIMTDHDLTT